MKITIREAVLSAAALIGGTLLVGLAVSGPSGVAPALPPHDAIRVSPPRPGRPAPPPAVPDAFALGSPIRPIRSSAGSRPPLPPLVQAPNDPHALADWLLLLPEDELSALARVRALDDLVARVVAGLSLSDDGLDTSLAIGDFLDRLDARLDSFPNQ